MDVQAWDEAFESWWKCGGCSECVWCGMWVNVESQYDGRVMVMSLEKMCVSVESL